MSRYVARRRTELGLDNTEVMCRSPMSRAPRPRWTSARYSAGEIGRFRRPHLVPVPAVGSLAALT